MNKNRGKLAAGLIATSIVVPMAFTVANAYEENTQKINMNEENIQRTNMNEENTQKRNIEYRMITGNGVNFRKGPSTSYSSLGKLNKGNKVEYIGKSGSWINAKYNGKVGYVHGDYVSSSSTSTNPTPPSDNTNNTIKSTKIVTGNGVNFRKGPSTSYSSLGKLNKGNKVGFISESNGWAKISYNGNIGYMSNKYLANTSETPLPPTPPTVPPVPPTPPTTDNSDETVKSTKVVTGNGVNLRKGPGTSYPSITKLNKGNEVGYILESNGWAKIKYNGNIGHMSSQYLKNKVETPPSDGSNENVQTSDKADKVINFGKTLLGKPYVWGAEGPNSFDCSGFTQYVFKKSVGVSIPRVSREQSKFGQSVSRNSLKKGDLIFFDTEGSNNGYVSHVGIYMGDNQFIHASSSKKKVMISSMNSYYNGAFVNARRVL